MCHLPIGSDPFFLLDVAESAQALPQPRPNISVDPFTELCGTTAFTFEVALTQVRDWLHAPGNEGEVVGLFLDDRVYGTDISHVVDGVVAVFGSEAFTPLDLAALGGVWPNTPTFLGLGKRVWVESNTYADYWNASAANTTLFYPTLWSAWQNDPTDTVPYPNCTIVGDASWYGSQWVRILEGSVVWAPDYDERTDGIVRRPNGYADMVACGITNVAVPDFSPEAQLGFIWSWIGGEPARGAAKHQGNCTAGAMTTVRGRWTAQPCTLAMPAVCRRGDPNRPSGNDPTAWALTPSAVTFASAPAACGALGAGWAFDVPRDGRENSRVADMLLGGGFWQGPGAKLTVPGVWLNVVVPPV